MNASPLVPRPKPTQATVCSNLDMIQFKTKGCTRSSAEGTFRLCSRRWPTMHPILPPIRPRIKCVARSRRDWVCCVLSWLLPETAHVVWPGAGTVLLILGRNAWFWNHFLRNHSIIGPINATMWNKAIQMSADLAGKPVEADLAADSASFWFTVTPVVGSIGSPFNYDRYNSKLDIFLPLIHSCCFNHIYRRVHL